ncbi:MAG: amidohydrolase family protein [Phycisphaerales bacterium]|nr:amidohydrolase family protein [Phycisphaerales bacterium]
MSSSGTGKVGPANRFGWDYRAMAQKLGNPGYPIIDAHTHIHGERACRLYDEARKLFGVTRTYTMTQLPLAQPVADALGDSIRFIAIPTWGHPDKAAAHRGQYLKDIETFHAKFGARMMKIWASPRLRDIVPGGATDLADIDSPIRREHCKLAMSLGMMFMVHVADPDTWFSTKYRDGSTYGTKAHQYVGLRRMLDEFPRPWIAAHMGGWPEDLGFLDSMLTAHPNLHLDTSATKWIVRELSKHPREQVREFFVKWRGRVLFGTDLVVMEDQLSPTKGGMSPMGDLASSPEEAFDLYCSRHWALRAMFETDYHAESPIADPDLKMVEPTKYDAMSAPMIRGLSLDAQTLKELYNGAATRLIEAWWAGGK